jgi:hypothetical protein
LDEGIARYVNKLPEAAKKSEIRTASAPSVICVSLPSRNLFSPAA